MKKVVLSVDIGASSGRVIVSDLNNNKIQLEEIHRFDNGISLKGNYYCWNIKRIFQEIKIGMKKAFDSGFEPISLGIDTWAVDFVLLDEHDLPVTDFVSYRDGRVSGMFQNVEKVISKEKLYSLTGIQFQEFNTVYQLLALKEQEPVQWQKAKTFLMIPDYLHFLLTGKKTNEYTNASSTQLLNARTRNWDDELIDKLGLKRELFQEVYQPGSNIGTLKDELVEELGFDVQVILPATHDTGSAIVSLPTNEDTIYISSGTWSLIGVENSSSNCTRKAMEYNFTNEGGVFSTYRFLKNVMGLWIIQEAKKLFDVDYTFEDLANMAKKSSIQSVVDVDDVRFLNPENMIEEIQSYCKETNQKIPETPGELAYTVFSSLTKSYLKSIEQIEELQNKKYSTIHIIGGGSKNKLLNKMLAEESERKVFAGPSEATAIGNSIIQFLSLNQIETLQEAREIVRRSIVLEEY